MTLLFEDDHDIESPLNTTRWHLILWILSIPLDYLEQIKQIAFDYRFIAIVLLFMVQVKRYSTPSSI